MVGQHYAKQRLRGLLRVRTQLLTDRRGTTPETGFRSKGFSVNNLASENRACPRSSGIMVPRLPFVENWIRWKCGGAPLFPHCSPPQKCAAYVETGVLETRWHAPRLPHHRCVVRITNRIIKKKSGRSD